MPERIIEKTYSRITSTFISSEVPHHAVIAEAALDNYIFGGIDPKTTITATIDASGQPRSFRGIINNNK